MIRILFAGIVYTRKQRRLLVDAVNQYALKIACKFCNSYGLPKELRNELRQEFMILFFEKIVNRKNIKCDLSTYFYRSCANKVKSILRNKKYKERLNLFNNEIIEVYKNEIEGGG